MSHAFFSYFFFFCTGVFPLGFRRHSWAKLSFWPFHSKLWFNSALTPMQTPIYTLKLRSKLCFNSDFRKRPNANSDLTLIETLIYLWWKLWFNSDWILIRRYRRKSAEKWGFRPHFRADLGRYLRIRVQSELNQSFHQRSIRVSIRVKSEFAFGRFRKSELNQTFDRSFDQS